MNFSRNMIQNTKPTSSPYDAASAASISRARNNEIIDDPTLRNNIYMAEKANHPWYKALDPDCVSLGTSRLMVSPIGKYISKYNMTIPKELAEYE